MVEDMDTIIHRSSCFVVLFPAVCGADFDRSSRNRREISKVGHTLLHTFASRSFAWSDQTQHSEDEVLTTHST